MGARAAGMADAYTAVADDALSLYYNPAGLARVKRAELASYYSRLFAGLDDKSEISRSFLGYVHPLAKRGGLGVSYVHLGLPGLYGEETLGLSYGKTLDERLNLGVSVKLLRRRFGTNLYTENAINVDSGASLGGRDPLFAKRKSKTGLGLDLGAQYRLSQNDNLGLALRNVNRPNMALGRESDRVASVYALGWERKTRRASLSLETASWKYSDRRDYRLSAAGERWFANGLALRTGLGLGSRGYANAALGASYRMDGFQFDYGINYPLGGVQAMGTHMVSLTFRFGKPEPDPLEAQLQAEREARRKAEAEIEKLKKQLLALTERPVPAPDTKGVDEALKQTEKEIRKAEPPKKKPAPSPKKPAKKSLSAALLKQYSESLARYTELSKSGAPLPERIGFLKEMLEKFKDQGIDLSVLQLELNKLETERLGILEDYNLALQYYDKIVQGGIGPEDRVILLERIIKKYKPLGVDTAEAEQKLAALKES